MSVSEVQSYCRSLEVLGSLNENERLLTNGRYFSKMRAPDRYFKDSKNLLAKIAHEILTLVMKIFQAIERMVRRESTSLNLSKVEEMTDELLQIFDGELPQAADESSYEVLKDLGTALHQLQNCADRSLAHLQETLLSRGASVDPTLSIYHQLQADKVSKLTEKISLEVLPKISALVSKVEEDLYDADKAKADQFFTGLFSKLTVNSTLRFSSLAALDSLKSRLGEAAIDRALEFYGLEHAKMLTGKDLIALTIGALANLTKEDLSAHLSNYEAATGSVIAETIIRLRSNINFQLLEPTKQLPYSRQLAHDQMVLQYLSEMEDWKAGSEEVQVRGLKHYSYAEYLARHITYALFNQSKTRFAEGIVIPMYDETNTLRLFTAHRLVSVKGLYGVMFKPMGQDDAYNKVHVAFRGTYCKSSILRDISPSETMQNHLFDGPGRYSFTKHQDTIYKNIIENLRGVHNPTLEFHGHSLGASDAMRSMEHFMHQQAERIDFIPVAKYILNAFNTPGVEPDVACRFMESARSLKVETDLRYFDVHHDFVQELGSTRLGYWRSHESCPDFMKISVYKFNRRVDERLKALAKNVFKRLKFNVEKALEAHTFNCLSLHDTDDREKINTTFIQNIYTNHPSDAGIAYGQDLSETSSMIEDRELADYLLTTTCKIGRSIKREALKAKGIFFGIFSAKPAQPLVESV